MRGLVGPAFRLEHSAHFTLLTDVEEAQARALLATAEDAYATFYRQTTALGMRPTPPRGRLVCVLFKHLQAFRDFLNRFEDVRTPWAAANYSWNTNRVVLFHDQDNEAFQEVRAELSAMARKAAELEAQLQQLGAQPSPRRQAVQEELDRLKDRREQMSYRLGLAAGLATASKARHEITHQLLANSGLLPGGEDVPFWLGEGLATCFEVCDEQGRAGPDRVNKYRLKSYREAQAAGKLLPLKRLLRSAPEPGEPLAQVTIRYAQAWAWMHFLWNRRPDQLRAYLQAAMGNPPSRHWEAMIGRHFGQNIQELEREWIGYMQELSAPPTHP